MISGRLAGPAARPFKHRTVPPCAVPSRRSPLGPRLPSCAHAPQLSGGIITPPAGVACHNRHLSPSYRYNLESKHITKSALRVWKRRECVWAGEGGGGGFNVFSLADAFFLFFFGRKECAERKCKQLFRRICSLITFLNFIF